MSKAVTVEQIDGALKRYYTKFQREYNNIFSVWYEENGFEDLQEEMGPGPEEPDDCLLLDFDDNFPFVTEPDDRDAAICKLLWKIYKNPNCDFRTETNEFKPLKISAEDFRVQSNSALFKNCTAKHQAQLNTIYDGEMKDDGNINHLLAISEKLKTPYLTYLADMFTRDRIAAHSDSKGQKSLEPSHWVTTNKHCKELARHVDKNAKDIVQHAVQSFFHRIVPKLMLNSQTQINDSLRETAEYILAQVEFVCKLAANATQLTCPFQVDACIAYNSVSMNYQVAAVPYGHLLSGGYGSASDQDDSDDDEEKERQFMDCFGNVKSKLSSEECIHSVGEFGTGSDARTRYYGLQFESFKKNINSNNKDDESYRDYPRNHRFCSFIDRREGTQKNGKVAKKDEIIFFEPPANCKTIPDGHVPLWFFDSSATSIIPNVGYHKQMKSKKSKKKLPQKRQMGFKEIPADQQNITSKSDCRGALLVLSFHVEAANEIRCYLYLNGQVTRFMASDIIQLLPRYFEDSEENKKWVKSKDAKRIVDLVHSKLIDSKFEAFYNEYKYGKH